MRRIPDECFPIPQSTFYKPFYLPAYLKILLVAFRLVKKLPDCLPHWAFYSS